MVEFKKGMIDKQQQGNILSVFKKFDQNGKDALTWEQFKDFVFAIGMMFLYQHYEEDIKVKLFEGDFLSNRVGFPAFLNYLDENCKYDNMPDQYERYMQVFDEDKNGQATVEDVIRAMETHGQMTKEEI